MTCQQSRNKKKLLFSKDKLCMIESEVNSQVPEEHTWICMWIDHIESEAFLYSLGLPITYKSIDSYFTFCFQPGYMLQMHTEGWHVFSAEVMKMQLH